jgi:hypothetical protein
MIRTVCTTSLLVAFFSVAAVNYAAAQNSQKQRDETQELIRRRDELLRQNQQRDEAQRQELIRRRDELLRQNQQRDEAQAQELTRRRDELLRQQQRNTPSFPYRSGW